MRPSAVLLVTCPDRPGIVAAVAGYVVEQGGTIVHADQHTDREHGLFLQRVEFEIPGGELDPGARERLAAAFLPVAERFGMRWSLEVTGQPARLAVLVSRQAHCLYDLLVRTTTGELAAEVVSVVSNHRDLGVVAQRFGVPFHHLPVTGATRARQEAALVDRLAADEVDAVVLARYMQVLGPTVVEPYRDRMINIHHSFLPAFAGARPYHQAYERGVKVIGATAHYVTEELDAGPIIEQDVVRVSHRDDVEDLVRKGRDLETIVLARAVRWHLERRVLVYGNRTVVFA